MAELKTALTLVGRALRRRCPACGRGRVYTGWMRARTACAYCGLRFDRGERDFFYGAYMFNLIAAELAFAAVFVAVLLATWPDPPWTLLTWGSAVLVVVAPFVFYPFTKNLWLAFDLLFRPHRKDAAP